MDDVLKKIKNIDIDAMQDIGFMEQCLEDNWISPFPQSQITERPDKASSSILEGRIVIIVDNSPFVLILPVIINSFFQASEDYYQNWEIMSFVRNFEIFSCYYGCLFTRTLYSCFYLSSVNDTNKFDF